MGLIGYGIHTELESLVVDLLTGSAQVAGLKGSWKVLTGFLILFSIPVAALSFVSVIFYSDNPEKRLDLFIGLKKTFISLVLISVSFFLYKGVLGFVQGFTDLSFLLVSGGGGFKESVFFTPFLKDPGVSAGDLLSGSVASNALFDVYLTGVYTVSLILLAGTLGVQSVLARFGLLLMPFAVFLYNLPFRVFDEWSFNVLKGLALVLFLPVLDVLFLGVLGGLPTGSRGERVVFVLGFGVVALINWGVVKRLVLQPFGRGFSLNFLGRLKRFRKGLSSDLKGFRRGRDSLRRGDSRGLENRDRDRVVRR